MQLVILLLLLVVILMLGGWLFAVIAGVAFAAALGGILMVAKWVWDHAWPWIVGGVLLLSMVGCVAQLRVKGRQAVVDRLRSSPGATARNVAAIKRPTVQDRHGGRLTDVKEQAFKEWLKGRDQP